MAETVTEKGRPVTIKDEGVTLTPSVSSIDFVGSGVAGTVLGDAVTETIGIGSGSNTFTSTQTIAPSSDVSALVLKEFSALPTTPILSIKNSSDVPLLNINRTILDGADTSTFLISGISLIYNTAGTVNPTHSRAGLNVILRAGFTGPGSTNSLAFENQVSGTGTKLWTMSNDFGLRPAGDRGFGGYSRLPDGILVGNNTLHIGGLGCAVSGTSGTASDSWGLVGTATVSKANSRNGGMIGVGYNTATGGLEFGLFAGLYNTTPTWGTISAASISDNGIRTAVRIHSYKRGGVEVAQVTPVGSFVSLSGPNVNTTNATKATLYTLNLTQAQYGDGLYSIDITIFGKSTSDTNWAVYKINQSLTVVSNVITLGNRATLNIYESDLNWDVGTEASGGNLLITVTGKAATNITWRPDIVINKN